MNNNNQAQLPLLLVLAYLLFIIYGSLLPFEYASHPLGFAWEKFQQTKMLGLAVQSRADWIANGILYIPAGFLVTEWLTGRASKALRVPAMCLAFLICASLATAIEFAQIFFPQRTVSQNDILAECIGSLAGIILAPRLGKWVRRLFAYRPETAEAGTTLLLTAYLAAYIAYSLFPYDLVLSTTEFADKLNSGKLGILLADKDLDGKFFIVLSRFTTEIATAIPLGVFFIRRNKAALLTPATSLIQGAALGLAIEVAQIFIYSGLSQGLSVLTRAIGCYAGALMWLQRDNFNQEKVKSLLKRGSCVLIVLYLFGLAGLAGWFSHPWANIDTALVAFSNVRLLPFYYHYYTSEAVALASLTSVSVMYLPVGVFAWIWSWSGVAAALTAAFSAFVIETSHLFFTDTHADPTNVLIAAISAWASKTLIYRLTSTTDDNLSPQAAIKAGMKTTEDNYQTTETQHIHSSKLTLSPNQDRTTKREEVTNRDSRSMTSKNWLIRLLVAGLSLFWLKDFPVQPLTLLLAFVAVGAAVWIKPIVAIAVIPAALPILDLAPWSGRFFLDEFDILLMVTLALGYLRTKSSPLPRSGEKSLSWSIGLLAISYAISAGVALLPLPSIDASSFTTYFSPYNAVRISKGLICALLFIGLYHRLSSKAKNTFRWFAWGTCIGLAITVALIAREKALFGGLFNFSSGYRATGPFSAIHIGGAFIECYLAIAGPFVILLIVRTENWLQRISATALLLATTYALMVTVSRNGFVAYAVSCALALLATLTGEEGKFRKIATIVAIASATLAVAIPIFKGDFTQQRMAQIGTDLRVRTAHWRDGLAMRKDNWLTALFGMGVGSYPVTHYWSSRETNQTSLHIPVSENGNTFLRIFPGNIVYVEQLVDISPHQAYVLSFDLRSPQSHPKLGFALCEKSLLTSTECATWQGNPLNTQPKNSWTKFEFEINSNELGSGTFLTKRPVKLSVFTNGNEVLDIDNVKLTSSSGQELILNGDFSENMDRWFFSTDEHLAWHMKSLPVSILFEQGWLGLIAFCFFISTSLLKSVRNTLSGNLESGIALAALSGFLVVGVFDTLIDAPRFLFIFVVLAVIAGFLSKPNTMQH